MFVGVDGGGTKTAFILLSAEARVLARAEAGTTYHPQVGLEGVRQVLCAGLAELLQRAQLPVSGVRQAFFGLPAFGEDPEVDPQLALTPGMTLADGQYSCGNDMVCGWAGALGCADGISVTAGTGSIAYGEFAGRSARAGGWGEVFGDEGSAYWIGREGLAAFSRMSDGRISPGPLQVLLRRHFNLSCDLDLAGRINDPGSAERSSIAQLARLVASAALEGDAAARDIFERGASELAGLVHAIRALLQVPEQHELPVSYSGGVFETGALVLEPFRAELLRRQLPYRVQPPAFPPVVGAALYAARAAGVRFTTAQLASLADSLKKEGSMR
jgi:N-acetylglucosamine kinase-like BadF-type ATPase